MRMTFRQLGKQVLSTVLNQEKNISIIEKYLFDISERETNNKDSLEEIYKQYVYQVVSDIIDKVPLKEVLNNIKTGKLGWKHPGFNNLHLSMEEQDGFIENPFEVVEGALECKCGSKRVFYYQKQVRSCDEPMTTFATCCACGNKWSYSG